MKKNLLSRALVVAGVLAAASSANAAAIVVTDVVAEISAQTAPIALIGSAVLMVFVAIKAFQWVRRALN